MYPSVRYHATEEPRTVNNPEEDEALGEGWASSPADHGIETAPGATPDPAIAANRPAEPEPVAEPKLSAKARKMLRPQ